MMMEQEELTEVEQKIFDKIKDEYWKRGITMVNIENIKGIIKRGNTHGDGLKRVSKKGGPTYLVPLEDIILDGSHVEDLDKYPVEE